MALQSRDDLIAKLHNKKFRDAFVSSRIANTLALQIRVMRQERGWSQAHLAKLLGTSQNAIYRLESLQYGKPSITTLKRLASIFDVGLAVWFAPFSKLVDRVMHLSTEDILVPNFDHDPGFQEQIATSTQAQTTASGMNAVLFMDSLQETPRISHVSTIDVGQLAMMVRSHASSQLPDQSMKGTTSVNTGGITYAGTAA